MSAIIPKILDKSFCGFEPLHMRDELTDFDGVNELPFSGLTPPGLNVGNRWPGVEGCVYFDGVEAPCVMLEPLFLRYTGIIRIPPFPVSPAGASDMNW
jgi:hypothetical protein